MHSDWSISFGLINVCTLTGQSALVYCAGKPMKKSRIFCTYYIKAIDHKFIWFKS